LLVIAWAFTIQEFIEWTSHPTISTVKSLDEDTSEEAFPFPAVTICQGN